MKASEMRLALRLARRELRRRPARAALVVLMVAIPAGGMAVATTLLRTSEWPPGAERRANFGQADMVAVATEGQGRPVGGDELAALARALPSGASILVERSVADRARYGSRRAYPMLSDLDLLLPLVQGRFGPVDGRLARAPGEVVITEPLARDLGIALGDTLTLDRLGRAFTVVGTVRPLGWQAAAAYAAPGSLADHPQRSTSVLLGTGGAAVAVPAGWRLTSLRAGSGSSKSEGVFWSYLGGGAGLVVLGTVVAAAFAVGARRQLRTVGLLASSGAPPRLIAWALVAQGAVAGVVGSVVGVVAGVALTRLLPLRLLDGLAGHPVAGPVTRAADLAPILAIGTVAAMVAAWLPARSAARVPVLAALAGRRPQPDVPRRLPLLGAVAMGAGCVPIAASVAAGTESGRSSLWPLVGVLGAVAVLLGALAIAPWLVARLEGLCGRRSPAWQLAGRSLARSRMRSSAVVGAIAAVAAMAVAGSTLLASFADRPETALPYLRADQVLIDAALVRPGDARAARTAAPVALPTEVVAALEHIAPGTRLLPLQDLAPAAAGPGQPPEAASLAAPTPGGLMRLRDPGSSSAALATPELLELFGAPTAARRALDAGGVVSVAGRIAQDRAVLRFGGTFTPEDAPPVTVAVDGWFDSPVASRGLPSVLVSPQAAERLGLVPRPSARTLALLPGPATPDQRRAISLLAEDLRWDAEDRSPARGVGQEVIVVSGPPVDDEGFSPALARVVVVGAALLLVMAVVGVGLALASTDSADEGRVLAAVGAPPRLLRRVGTRRAALLVLAAAALALPAGLLPAIAIVAAADHPGADQILRVDPWTIAFLVAALPTIVAGLVAAAAAGRDALRSPFSAVVAVD